MKTLSNAVEAQEVVVIKAPSKMDLVRPIFEEIYTEGYKLSEGCKSQRAEFIKRAQEEASMTKNGAATYFQNLSNQAKGQALYKYNVAKKVNDEEQTKETVNQATTALDETTEESAEKSTVGLFRWITKNAEGEETASFESRAKAQAAALVTKQTWADRNK